jgi:zinc transport system substrate-binding protein
MNKRNLIIILVLLALVASFIFITKKSQTNTASNKLQITTSFYPLYFFANEIGGTKADIKNITPAGAEPHDYEPTSQEIARIENSNLLILNGGLEAWGDKIKTNLQGKQTYIVIASEGLLTQQLEEAGKKAQDPHVWLDPKLAKKEVERIKDGYIKVDPTNASYYETNAKNLENKLDKLYGEYKQGLSTCKQKDIVTSHAAFGYLAKEYGLNQVAISGLSPDAEPSSQQLADVAKFAKDHNVKYIFFESLVSPKLSETIANEIGAKTLVLDPIEGLSDDDIKQGKNYFTVMGDNLKNLQTALECNK